MDQITHAVSSVPPLSIAAAVQLPGSGFATPPASAPTRICAVTAPPAANIVGDVRVVCRYACSMALAVTPHQPWLPLSSNCSRRSTNSKFPQNIRDVHCPCRIHFHLANALFTSIVGVRILLPLPNLPRSLRILRTIWSIPSAKCHTGYDPSTSSCSLAVPSSPSDAIRFCVSNRRLSSSSLSR